MTILPVVERELRVASRKRSTYWVRVIAAAAALVIGSGFLILARVTPLGLAGASMGSSLFATLTWLSLAGALSAGVFFTSDCLSEEKRDGTIGFLFLTDLRGHDIVLGKLMATSLRAGCAMIGVFPILALTLLMGGVSIDQFWRTCLALGSALFISLSAGLAVSAISWLSQKALAVTGLLLLTLSAGGPLGDAAIAASKETAFNPILSHSSPVFLFMNAATSATTPKFWPGLIANGIIGGALLGFAFILLPRAWQQKNQAARSTLGNWTRWWKLGGPRVRVALRYRLLDLNPVLWLACRERWQAVSLWAIAVFQAGVFAAIFYQTDIPIAWMAWSSLAGLLTLALYLGLASHAGRFFVEARRSGLLELVLATPLPANQVVRGQWHALLRMFGLPLAICLLTQAIGGVLVQQMTWGQLASSVPANTGVTGIPGFEPPGYVMALAMAGAGTLIAAANLLAIAWFGMWMGLTSKTTNQATLKTILFVQVIPWFAISFAAGMIIPLLLMPTLMRTSAGPPAQLMFWYPFLSTIVAAVLNLAKDAFFISWSRRKLRDELRERVILRVPSTLNPAAP
jgi:ABC-type transport system involved in cytochrome c biogenesis permease component